MKKLFILLLSIVAMSCKGDVYVWSNDPSWHDELIESYIKADTIILKSISATTSVSKPTYKYSDLKLQVFGLEGMKSKPASLRRVDNKRFIAGYDIFYNPDAYDSLKTVHNDYIRTKNYELFNSGSTIRTDIAEPSLFERLVSLDIYADEDYDAAHPAGTKLNDIARITFYCIDEIATADDFSGVKQKLDLSNRDFEHTEPLDEFNAKKRKFMAYNFTITLTSPPAQKQNFVFRIDYEHENALLTVTSDPITVTP